MSGLSARERGDLAEEMLPVAAGLVAVVHGEGDHVAVGEILDRLNQMQKDALIVVLAGLIDPERPVGEALGWLAFDEHGNHALPPRGVMDRVRDLAPAESTEEDGALVDETAVALYAEGKQVAVTDEERLRAIVRCAERGITYREIDSTHGLGSTATSVFVDRMRRRYAREGRQFPEIARPDAPREFTEEEVVDIRTRSAAGTADLLLALSYDVDALLIGKICRGTRYPHFGGPTREPRKKPSRNTRLMWNGDTGRTAFAQAS